MPPKKQAQQVRQVTALFILFLLQESAVTYPVQECKFTVTLVLDHAGGHNVKVKYDWFGNN